MIHAQITRLSLPNYLKNDHDPNYMSRFPVVVCSLGGFGIVLTLINWIVLWARRKRLIKFVSTENRTVRSSCLLLTIKCIVKINLK